MKKLQLFLIFLLLSGIGFAGINSPVPSKSATAGQSVNAPALLTGPTSVCLNSTGNVYTTDPGQANYVWSITGGTITSGGTSTANTATVTWTAAGAKSITVNYDGATANVLPVTVNPLTSSVAISASATSVYTGASVTFTATPTNGGTTPAYQWKVNGNNAGTNSNVFTYTPSNGDAVYCILTPNAPCVSSSFTSAIITITVTSQPLLVTVSRLTANPGQVVYFPVKLKGASASGSPISAASLQITYDPAVLHYDTLVNFYASTPVTQWFFSGNLNTVAANWQEPGLNTVAIPDSTTLFEIQFTYLGGISTLPFTLNEFLDAQFNLVNTTHVDGAIAPLNPDLSGPATVCQGSAGNVYVTGAGQTNYSWSVTGGTITSGGAGSDNSATVTWNTAGAGSISVSCTGSVTTTLPVTVNPLLTVSVSIAASANPGCANASVTFTATAVNGGSTPAYQWKKNGSNISGATNVTYTYMPVNNDAITFVLTSNGTPCVSGSPATSNAIAMTVYPLTASISITASANPVMAGTPVTFTANATNGGPAPSFQWKVNNTVIPGNSTSIVTYTPENGDVIICILTSSAPCVTSLFTSNVINMTVNYPVGSLLVTLPNKTAMPGDVLYYPVKLKGASAAGTPVSAASIQISYDPAVFHYDTLVNFYASTPVAQWFFSGNLNTVAANWQEPGLNAIAIPDSTTLFEIKFTYLGGNATLPFTVNEFTNAVYDLIPTNHINGGVTQLVPTNNTIQNLTVATAHDTCFSAIQVLTVAGSGTNVTVENGGSVTFVAGQQISFLPGTTVISGGYLHGYITTNGQYCTQLPNPVVMAKSTEEETTSTPEMTSSQSIRAYPNPTTGIFTVEVRGDNNAVMTKVEIYTISGMKVQTVNIDHERKHEFNLSGLNTGIYFIHVFTNERSEILKIVKL